MMSLLRRLVQSKVGLIITFAGLIIIALLFGMGGQMGQLGGGGQARGDEVAKVGKAAVGEQALQDEVRQRYSAAQRDQPSLTMPQFVQQGGFDGALQGLLDGIALDQFGQSQGMAVSKRLIDGQIASISAFKDASGQFSQQIYETTLAQRQLSDAQVRHDFAQGIMAQQLIFALAQRAIFPASQVPVTPQKLALPYASQQLEARQGEIGFVPSAIMGQGTPPTDAEIAQYYKQHIDRYSFAERRIIRYATVSPDAVKAQTTPTDAEIAARYQRDHAQYVATEKRDLTQVVLLDENAAKALAAKAKSGGSMEDAARAAGLEAAKVTGVQKADYAKQASPDTANAVFAATKGSVIGPVKSAFGWTVIRVDAINQIAGKSLEQARPEIVKALTTEKTAQAMTAVHDALDSGIDGNSTFDELVADQKLKPVATAPLLADGSDPTKPGAKPDPAIVQIATGAFQAEQGDEPQLVPTGADGSFALVALDKILLAAPRPLADVKTMVARDFSIDRAKAGARQIAGKVVAAVDKGASFAAALQAAHPDLPPAKPMNATRAQLNGNLGVAGGPLKLLFSMNQGSTKVYEAPGNTGWWVIHLLKITPGDASSNAKLVASARQALDQVIGQEHVEEFVKAVHRSVGTSQNAAAIKTVRDQLSGEASGE